MDTPEIDQSLRKHRQLRGTPSNRVSTLISLGILGVGTAVGLFMHFSSKGKKLLEYSRTGELMQISEAQKNLEDSMRSQLRVGVLNFKSSDEIKEGLKDFEKNVPSAEASNP